MRLRAISWILGAVFATVPAPACARPGPTLEGDWDVVIAAPERPWIFLARFERAGAGWSGAMSVEGEGQFELRDVRMDSTHVHFRLPPELDSMAFEGTLVADTIVGAVLGGGQSIATRLTRVVRPAAPANRIQAWQQDLDFAAARMSEYDRSFSPEARQQFRESLDAVRRALRQRSDAEILVALSRAIALAGNAHSRLRLDPTRQGIFSTVFPLRIWWFSDGPWVLKAAPEYRRALRCRVVAIGGHDIAEAKARVSELFAGNDSWKDYLSPLYLTSPDVLFGLGMIAKRDVATFTFEDAHGNRFDLEVRGQPIDPAAMPQESWQDLSPFEITGRPPWASALPAVADSLPLYLWKPSQPYWFEFLPGSGILYFQFNRAANADSGQSFKGFGDSLLSFAAQHPTRALVVDLRLNSGGDLGVAKSFMKSLGANPTINQPGRLFVVVGHCTFSAGLYHAVQLKQFTKAVFVGEPVGDRLDFWAEGGRIVLPFSRAVIDFSNGFHGYSGVDHPQFRPYYEELNVPNLRPDMAAATSSKDYFGARDPALEAIEVRIRR